MIPEVEKKQLMGLQHFTKRQLATARLATKVPMSQKSRYPTKIDGRGGDCGLPKIKVDWIPF
jgi:hypothetical protein